MSPPATPLHSMLPWRGFFLRYVCATFGLNLIWEMAQLPLYTIWKQGSFAELTFAVVHCTLGDVIIACLTLLGSVLCLGNSQWPRERYVNVAAATVAAGLAYTGYSEWLNVYVRKSWAYSDLMPKVMGLGLSPLLQWVIIPTAAFAYLSQRPQAPDAH
jgi:hypothetical protein